MTRKVLAGALLALALLAAGCAATDPRALVSAVRALAPATPTPTAPAPSDARSRAERLAPCLGIGPDDADADAAAPAACLRQLEREQAEPSTETPAETPAAPADGGFRFHFSTGGEGGASQGLDRIQSHVADFDSAEAARSAMRADRDAARRAPGAKLADARVPALGDEALGLSGTTTEGGRATHAAFVWVRQGERVYAFAGWSTVGDPLPDLLAAARDSLEG